MDDYSYAYISEPVEFRQLEGRAIDFRKTFDVRGQGVDEMLQLYLRKANLSDDLDRLPAIMRRAYVYDIIRSNKGPGYWVPPSMQVSSDVFAHPPPAVRPPPYYADNASINGSLDGMKSSSSSNSLDRYAGAPPAVALAGPSFATSVLVSSKGSKYEISGPVNFQHVSGDVTRDRTRNAFDLNAESNDNVLRKYMMERGITEADISDMRRQDVIKKIVHSNFTWMPTKSDLQAKPHVQEPVRPLLYATISTNNQITPPPSPPPVPMATVAKPAPVPNFSNYASLTSRFVDISDMDLPAPGSVPPDSVRQQEVGSVIPVYVQPQQQQQVNRPKVPPPPSAVTANNSHAHGYPAAIDIRQVRPSPTQKAPTATYATISPQRKAGTMRIPPPAPPKPTIVPNTNSTASMSQVQYAPAAKPPPPTPPVKPTGARTPSAYIPPAVVPKQVYNHVPAAPPPIQMQNNKLASGHVPSPPPPPAPSAAVPPPPPPMPIAAAGGAPPPPPPPPAGMAGVPPPPPMQKSQPTAAPVASAGGDDRGALLASIRQGVALKKVDQKAATISGIKPRPERKPATTDFLSELKLGITLRRVKNPADNPYSDESQA
ncbi:formin-like protein 20 isoform X2 [Drosophila serrata]|uniref:formin-like protein 20 isoform X2 n=1 Tax=Drosophila serrata TaxID=7274 RepID=UPI000A1D17E8|nr:formin-like protein 20 isoform X2 [Drosophila serrata]